ncbi:MAG: hypothetical protein Q8Q20_03250 [bacterium]|nr:hypothetical protein [bacterium]
MRRITLDSIVLRLAGGLVFLFSAFTAAAILDRLSGAVVWVGLIAGLLAFLYWILRDLKRTVFDARQHDWLLLLCVVVVSLATGFFHHDIPRGRDDMGYISAAVKISETGSLQFDDVISRPYHPFRVVEGDTFTSQFLPAYNVYLAVWHLIGGLEGLLWANSLLVFIALFALVWLARAIFGGSAGLITALLFASSYLFSWFPRRTYSENLFLAVFWLSALIFLKAVKEKHLGWLGFGLFASSFLPLIRLEGVAFAAVYFIMSIFFVWRWRKETAGSKWLGVTWAALAAGNLAQLQIYGSLFGEPYIEKGFEAAGSALNYFWGSGLGIGLAAALVLGVLMWRMMARRQQAFAGWRRLRAWLFLGIFIIALAIEFWYLIWSGSHPIVDWTWYKLQFVLENFWYYAILPFVLIGLYGWYRHLISGKAVLVILLALPSFIFLIDPNIAVDQPWFMRRYYPVLIPLVFLIAGGMLASLVKGYRLFVLLIVALAVNLSISFPLLSYSDHRGVQEQLQDFSSRFQPGDLVVMTPGWHWQQWGYAFHYLYDVDALPNLDGFSQEEFRELVTRYDRVFVMSEAASQLPEYYSADNLNQAFIWSLRYPEIVPTVWLADYVNEYKRELNLVKMRENQQGTPPREIREIEQEFTIYQVQDPSRIEFPEEQQ